MNNAKLVPMTGTESSILCQLAQSPSMDPEAAQRFLVQLSEPIRGIGRAILGAEDVSPSHRQAADGCLQWASQNAQSRKTPSQ
jgi:hypothetical protein